MERSFSDLGLSKDFEEKFINLLEETEIQELMDNYNFTELFIKTIESGITFDDLAKLFTYLSHEYEAVRKNFNLQETRSCVDKYFFNKWSKSIETYKNDSSMDLIPSGYFADNDLLEEIDIKDNIKSLGNKCFKNCKNLKRINFIGKGLIRGGSGSNIFEGCNNLKEVHADNLDVLHYKFDTNGSPYFKGVKIYLNDKEIVPLVLRYEFNPGTWNMASGRKIINIDNVSVKESNVFNKNIDADKYYSLFSCFIKLNNELNSKIQILTYDAPTYCLEYNYLGIKNRIEWDCTLEEHNKRIYNILQNIVKIINSMVE